MSNTGLALQRGAVFEVFSCCRQPFSQDPKLTPKRDPKSAKRDRAPKRTQTKHQPLHQHGNDVVIGYGADNATHGELLK